MYGSRYQHQRQQPITDRAGCTCCQGPRRSQPGQNLNKLPEGGEFSPEIGFGGFGVKNFLVRVLGSLKLKIKHKRESKFCCNVITL